VAAFDRYWRRHDPGRDGAQARILAEPVWTGRSAREIAAWKRMESALNVALARASIFMICPYDTRITSISDPFLGLRPAGLDAAPGDGLWLTSQICDWMDIRSSADGGTIRLQVPGQRNAETAQQGLRYPT
jgi:hypothetical protein